MLTKQATFTIQLNPRLPAVFLLLGQELFLQDMLRDTIRTTWYANHQGDVDRKTLAIQDPKDWDVLEGEAQSFSLFAHTVFLEASYEKKTLEAALTHFLKRYLDKPNERCLLLLRAPQLTAKSLQAFANHKNLHIIVSELPTKALVQEWIIAKLKTMTATFDRAVPALIYQYTEGNLQACSQLLEQLALLEAPITEELLHSSATVQTAYPLFELANACLQAEVTKALQLLRQAACDKTEPTLILWHLAEVIRNLLQLQSVPAASFADTAGQLKIWPRRFALYQNALKRLGAPLLGSLLKTCTALDQEIKTSNRKQGIWQTFEAIAVSLCLGLNYAA